VLALDQGGGSSRAIAFDRGGEIVSTASRRVSESRIGADRVEQDPEELVRSIQDVIAECTKTLGERAHELVTAGLATQRSSLVCWDRTSGAPLSPVISWQDRRAAAWLDAFALDRADIRARTGLLASPHYGASKMRWCLDHLPAVREAHAGGTLAIGPLASFLVFRLAGEHPFVADPANASRTLLWNIHTSDWDPVLCARFGVPIDVLPRCVPTRHAFGSIDGVPLEVVNGDQSAAAFADGEPRADTVYVNIGTGAFVQRPIGAKTPKLPRLLHSVILRDASRTLSVIEGTINGAGSAIDRIGGELGFAEVSQELDFSLGSSIEPPLYLNGVSGLAAPFWSPSFRSRFIGDGPPHARLAAVGESIVFLIRAILDEMATELAPPARLCISGGLALVDGLCQRIADLSGLPVERSPVHEATARGLARLLAHGFEEERASSAGTFTPRASAALSERFERWTVELRSALASEPG
jgi:glycerol kinase